MGSAASLNGKGLGAEIDAHDTVVRINRLPTKEIAKDLGEKATIYFKNWQKDFRADGVWTIYFGEGAGVEGNNMSHRCYWKDLPSKDCPFESVFFSKINPFYVNLFGPKTGQQEEGKHFGAYAKPLPLPDSFRVGEDTKAMRHLFQHVAEANRNADGTWHIMSAGMMAFLSFAPLCDSISLYGFTGTGPLDNHIITPGRHDFAQEHRFLNKLADGREVEFYRDRAGRHHPEAKALAEKLAKRLTCLSKAGEITVVGRDDSATDESSLAANVKMLYDSKRAPHFLSSDRKGFGRKWLYGFASVAAFSIGAVVYLVLNSKRGGFAQPIEQQELIAMERIEPSE